MKYVRAISCSLAVLGVVAAIAGCTTVPLAEVPARPEALRQELEDLLAAGSPSVAVARIDALRRDGLLTSAERTAYQDRAVRRMQDAYGVAIEEERFADALRLHGNLSQLEELSEEAVDAGRGDELRVRYADHIARDGFGPGALSELLKVSNLAGLAEATLLRYSELARSLNDRRSASAILDALATRGAAIPEGLGAFIAKIPRPDEMIQGTVTVWVNRGIRLEGGVGLPDRVIGSGFFVEPSGYLVTNYHVIASEVDPKYEGYSRLYVRLPDAPNERVPARVVSWSRIFDIAVLKIEVDAPYVFSFSNIRTLQPGTPIIAIGSPVGLENSISSGIISAVGRRFLQMGDALQVDVPVNPGNSGGPLLDRDGDLVGVVFAGLEQYEGLNFAIPSFWVQHFLSRLSTEGEVIHPWIGVAVYEANEGLEVLYVAKNSPAEIAGLRTGDVVTHIGGAEATGIGEAQHVILDHWPGSLLSLSWLRDGEPQHGVVALAERPYLPVEEALQRDTEERLFPALFGMRLRPAGGALQRNFVVDEVYPGSVADESGISPEDPLVVRDFALDEDLGVAFLRVVVKKRTEGFWQSGLQLPAYVDTDNFL
jgi:serine protease Do